MSAVTGDERQEIELHGVLAEFRTALRDELEAARRAASSGAIQLVNGRRIAQVGGAFQYLFFVESALNVPEDSPGDLFVPGSKPVETTVISVDGLAITLSVPIDVGSFVPKASLQSDLTHLLRKLIERIEELRDAENPAGARLLGEASPSGDLISVEPRGLNAKQAEAVASSIGRDTTFIWGPPGTGKTRTIGRIGFELEQRGRSLLLVSHTNAAVDQAIIKIADELGEKLVDGSVLRLGEPKDQALLDRPRLLASTHIEERSAALVEERTTLVAERSEVAARAIEAQQLLAIWDWLPVAEADIAAAGEALATVTQLERALAQAEATVAALRAEGEELLPRAALAREAEKRQARLEEVIAELERSESDLAQAEQELAVAAPALATAERLLADCRAHASDVDQARARLAEIAGELTRERPLAVAAAAELEAVGSELGSAEELLAQTQEVTGLVRRWRGLPKPEEQEQRVTELRERRQSIATAQSIRTNRIAELEREQRAKAETVERWGHLPATSDQERATEAAEARAERARAQRDDARTAVETLVAERRDLGLPWQEFVDAHGNDPAKVIEGARAFEQLFDGAKSREREARTAASVARERLEDELAQRLEALRDWGLTSSRARAAEEALEAIGHARAAASERVAGTSAPALRAELETLNARVRAIDRRLEEIEDELQRVEELVIGEARIVATTLTRAYKRESVKKRRFDTVILDEASMAPIPALWVAAALADKNVILVGDFKQLAPIKHSEEELAERWLGRDVFKASGVQDEFERGEPPAHFVQLQEQFRMHPDISAISNHFVYSGTLIDGPNVRENDGALEGWYEFDWGFDSPVLLVDTGSLNAWVTSVSNAGRTSRLNFLSATACVDIAEMLLRAERPEPENGHPRVLVGAPYRPQAKLLNLLLRDSGLEREVVAGTAHTFQGSEAPVVIFDLVNDEPHWKVAMFMERFSGESKRLLNVALTRAQRRLIIVGDFDYIVKQGKKAHVRELIDFLRKHYPVVEAAQIIPASLSARAARAQIQVKAGGVEDATDRVVVTQDAFDQHLLPDLEAATKRVVIFSPFLTNERVGTMQPALRGAVDRGVRVWVVTKEHKERGRGLQNYRQIEDALRSWGVTVVHKSRMHEKLVFVDDEVLWHGSLNALSFTDTQEIMERRRSRAVVEDYERTLRLADLLAAYDAQETVCPFCGSEVVAAEGKNEPFYWRCVEDGCYTRSIGDPMPKNGLVVCSSSGCGEAVRFGYWGDDPHWRCEVNHRHRMRIVRSHLRLPKMRAIVPTRELAKLDKAFGLDGGANGRPPRNDQLGLL